MEGVLIPHFLNFYITRRGTFFMLSNELKQARAMYQVMRAYRWWVMRSVLLLGAIAYSAVQSAGVYAQSAGRLLYQKNCVACHQATGEGIPGIAPPLKDNIGTYISAEEGKKYLAQILLRGMVGSITVQGVRYNSNMPGFDALSDEDIASLLGYVLVEMEGLNNGDIALWLSPDFIRQERGVQGSPTLTYQIRHRLLTPKK